MERQKPSKVVIQNETSLSSKETPTTADQYLFDSDGYLVSRGAALQDARSDFGRGQLFLRLLTKNRCYFLSAAIFTCLICHQF